MGLGMAELDLAPRFSNIKFQWNIFTPLTTRCGVLIINKVRHFLPYVTGV